MNIVRFSPDGELFCTGSADCKAFLFNGKTAEEVGPLGGDKAHAGGIYGVSDPSCVCVCVCVGRPMRIVRAGASYSAVPIF